VNQVTLYTNDAGYSLNRDFKDVFFAWDSPNLEGTDFTFQIDKSLVKLHATHPAHKSYDVMTKKPIDFKPYQSFQK
jgi:hypothetical protein